MLDPFNFSTPAVCVRPPLDICDWLYELQSVELQLLVPHQVSGTHSPLLGIEFLASLEHVVVLFNWNIFSRFFESLDSQGS